MTGIIKRLTANFGLRIPIFDAPNWGRELEKNFDIIDAGLYSLLGMGNVRGLWDNNTLYTQGDRAVDPVSGEIYQAEQTHTSPATGTFAQARTANPTRWKRVLQSAQYKGQWKTATVYNSNEFLHDGISKYGVVIDKYTSGASYAADVAAGKIYTLIDTQPLIDDVTAKSTTATTKAAEAAASATAAKTSETNAKTSETNALASKNAAATSASNAATSATAAAGSATAANTSKTAAATSEANALTYRNSASTSASSAAASASAADNARIAAETAAATTSAFEVQIHGATAKTSPDDADEFGVVDSAASWARKKLTWANLKKSILASPVATALMALDVTGTGRGDFIWRRSGNDRWHLGLASGTETGADAGSNLELVAYNDAGAFKRTQVTFNRQNGTVIFSNQILGPNNDTAAAPSHSWSGDPDTGMWRVGAGQIGWTIDGVNRMTLDNNYLTLARIRLTSTTDASEGSTGHAFQIGPDTGANIRIDGNEILTVNNGAPGGELYIQNGVTFGTGVALGVANGGTGGDTPAAARTSLGVFCSKLIGPLSSNYTVTVNDAGALLEFNGSANRICTLPAASAVGVGFVITVRKSGTSNSTTVKFVANGSDTFSGDPTLYLSSQTVTLVCVGGGTWRVISEFGTVQSGSNSNGSWTRWADGTQICTGDALITPVANSPTALVQTFAAAFSSAPKTSATGRTNSSAFLFAATSSITATSMEVVLHRSNATATGIDWVAIGRWYN